MTQAALFIRADGEGQKRD